VADEDRLRLFSLVGQLCLVFPSVLLHCWLGDRKAIHPVKEPLSPVKNGH